MLRTTSFLAPMLGGCCTRFHSLPRCEVDAAHLHSLLCRWVDAAHVFAPCPVVRWKLPVFIPCRDVRWTLRVFIPCHVAGWMLHTSSFLAPMLGGCCTRLRSLPRRGDTSQPRATPWVTRVHAPSPEGATQAPPSVPLKEDTRPRVPSRSASDPRADVAPDGRFLFD